MPWSESYATNHYHVNKLKMTKKVNHYVHILINVIKYVVDPVDISTRKRAIKILELNVCNIILSSIKKHWTKLHIVNQKPYLSTINK